MRRGIIAVVLASVVTAVLAGLARMGIEVGFGPVRAAAHGPLFVLGVFATAVGLERAVAIARPWALAAPALGAAGAVAMLAGLPLAPWLSLASCAALVLINVALVRELPASFTWLMLEGSLLLALGAALLVAGRPVADAAAPWMSFLVLTIAAERLELSRLAPTPRWASRALGIVTMLAGLLAAARALGPSPAMRGLGLALTAIGAWQIEFDLARRTLRKEGLPRFAAVGVLAGAGWLALSGLFLASVELPPVGPIHDAGLHGVFVGYALSMVFAHAPIVLPAVARLEVRFSRLLYLPLGLLHAGLAARIAGDLALIPRLRQAGAVGIALAMAGYAAVLLLGRADLALSRRQAAWLASKPR